MEYKVGIFSKNLDFLCKLKYIFHNTYCRIQFRGELSHWLKIYNNYNFLFKGSITSKNIIRLDRRNPFSENQASVDATISLCSFDATISFIL